MKLNTFNISAANWQITFDPIRLGGLYKTATIPTLFTRYGGKNPQS